MADVTFKNFKILFVGFKNTDARFRKMRSKPDCGQPDISAAIDNERTNAPIDHCSVFRHQALALRKTREIVLAHHEALPERRMIADSITKMYGVGISGKPVGLCAV